MDYRLALQNKFGLTNIPYKYKWNDTSRYDARAAELCDMFRANFDRNDFASYGIRATI